MPRSLVAILICLLMPGCVIVKVSVTNPIDGLSTVAVAPFFNLSQERAVDGRRFALAYFAELQKVPGFQVLPVGVTEQTITDHGLEMDKPEDVLELARLLKVDAVVVGAVTDYDPYYPPRIGLHVEWYSPRPWGFSPGIPTDPQARTRWRDTVPQRWRIWNWRRYRDDGCNSQANRRHHDFAERLSVRAQSPQPVPVMILPRHGLPVRWWRPPAESIKQADHAASPEQLTRVLQIAGQSNAQSEGFRSSGQTGRNAVPTPGRARDSAESKSFRQDNGSEVLGADAPVPDRPVGESASAIPSKFDSRKPLMSYTRIFDGVDADLLATMRDYVELSGNQRGGGWEAYLHRSEDFIRFTAHLMIVEMLTLHGGDARRQIVFKMRKYK